MAIYHLEGPILMTSTELNYLLESLPADSFTLGMRASKYEFWGVTVQSIAVTFEQMLERDLGAVMRQSGERVATWGKSVVGMEMSYSKCKGPEAGSYLEFSKNKQIQSVT